MPDEDAPVVDLSPLDLRFGRLRQEYPERRRAAYAAVVRWQWYSADAVDLRPLWYERHRWRPGQPLAERPSEDRDHHRIGFDAEGRAVVIEEYSGFLRGTLYYETLRSAAPDTVEEAHFRSGGEPIYLHEYRFEADRIRSASTAATGGGGHETYAWTGDRVTLVRTWRAERTGRPARRLGPLTPYQTITAGYDHAGLSRLEIDWSGHRTELVYERPPAGFTLDAAVETAQRELVRQVPEEIRQMAVDEPAYCVALGYLPNDPLGTLTVHVGLDSQRRDWLAEAEAEAEAGDEVGAGAGAGDPGASDDDPAWIIWNPSDLHHLGSVELETLPDTVRLLRQELIAADAAAGVSGDHADTPAADSGGSETAAGSDGSTPTADSDGAGATGSGINERVRGLLCAVAADLNAYHWSPVLPVTDDFVVYAVDWELVDLDRNFPECVPADRLTLLRERGLR